MPLSPAATMIVFAVILSAPIVGAVLMWPAQGLGAWIVALTMAGAFAFGVLGDPSAG